MDIAYGKFGNTVTDALSGLMNMMLSNPLSALNMIAGWVTGKSPTKRMSDAIGNDVVSGHFATTLGIPRSDIENMSDKDLEDMLVQALEKSPQDALELVSKSIESEDVNPNTNIIYRRRSNIIGTGLQGLTIE